MLNLEPCYNGQTTSEERRLFSQRLFSRTVKFSGFQCSHRIYFKCGVEKTWLQIIATNHSSLFVLPFFVPFRRAQTLTIGPQKYFSLLNNRLFSMLLAMLILQ